jgi:hypothetical protein
MRDSSEPGTDVKRNGGRGRTVQEPAQPPPGHLRRPHRGRRDRASCRSAPSATRQDSAASQVHAPVGTSTSGNSTAPAGLPAGQQVPPRQPSPPRFRQTTAPPGPSRAPHNTHHRDSPHAAGGTLPRPATSAIQIHVTQRSQKRTTGSRLLIDWRYVPGGTRLGGEVPGASYRRRGPAACGRCGRLGSRHARGACSTGRRSRIENPPRAGRCQVGRPGVSSGGLSRGSPPGVAGRPGGGAVRPDAGFGARRSTPGGGLPDRPVRVRDRGRHGEGPSGPQAGNNVSTPLPPFGLLRVATRLPCRQSQ